ncbi:nuclear transport factor 2 family protein [Eleftheria terrae]|uniref:nuclear transport factor 2 family protein n=1 Tax=Eleftheria terrae TaxID=1597781 RepID=UPI00263B92AA|nr:nuclear transport factor 2 family protein [Eleftheria terrae]WKB50942.1 nuclear transport factor 2 family protein [Eleftheria terrae]
MPHPHDPTLPAHVGRLVRFFESMQPAALAGLDQIYRSDSRFTDPFHAVEGLPAITAIYRRMFDTLQEPHFRLTQVVSQGAHCFVTWDFLFRFRRAAGTPHTVRGASHLVFDAEGRVAEHRDYWDAAGEFYAKLPLLGRLMHWLRRRVAGA